jgi:hypothetical protein
MGETEKPAAEAAVVPPPPHPPAALPLGPQPGVKYPIQESHFMVSRPVVLIGSIIFQRCASSLYRCLRSWYINVWSDPHLSGKLDPDPHQIEKHRSGSASKWKGGILRGSFWSIRGSTSGKKWVVRSGSASERKVGSGSASKWKAGSGSA